MQQELEIIQGVIGAIVFQNYDNGYAVLRLNVGGAQHVTVVGTIPLPAVGERLMVTGKWSNHPTFGRQFEAEFLERMMPQTSMEIPETSARRRGSRSIMVNVSSPKCSTIRAAILGPMPLMIRLLR